MAVRAHIMDTQASVTALLFPFLATTSIMGRMEWTVRATSIGTWAAYLVSFCMASLRIAFSSSVSFGSLNAEKTRSYASESRSTSVISWRVSSSKRTERSSIISFTSTYFLRPMVRLATIAASEVARAPLSAETLPPPGTGSLLSTLLINSLMVSSVNMAISI